MIKNLRVFLKEAREDELTVSLLREFQREMV